MKELLSILKEWGAACYYYFYYETGTGTSSAWHQEAEGQTWGPIFRREVVRRFGALMTGLCWVVYSLEGPTIHRLSTWTTASYEEWCRVDGFCGE